LQHTKVHKRKWQISRLFSTEYQNFYLFFFLELNKSLSFQSQKNMTINLWKSRKTRVKLTEAIVRTICFHMVSGRDIKSYTLVLKGSFPRITISETVQFEAGWVEWVKNVGVKCWIYSLGNFYYHHINKFVPKSFFLSFLWFDQYLISFQ
jgi:hypothetical protein